MIVIKFLHVLALMMGAAASIANLVLSSRIKNMRSGAEPSMTLRPVFSRIGLFAVLLIWITGVWLYIDRWDRTALGPIFMLKLLAAALLLVAISTINIAGAKAKRTGEPVPMFIQQLGPATLMLTIVAVAAAVWVFD